MSGPLRGGFFFDSHCRAASSTYKHFIVGVDCYIRTTALAHHTPLLFVDLTSAGLSRLSEFWTLRGHPYII